MQLKYTNLKFKPKYYIKFIKSTVFHETEHKADFRRHAI